MAVIRLRIVTRIEVVLTAAAVVVGRRLVGVGFQQLVHGDDWFLGAVAQRVRIVALGAAARANVAPTVESK